ncbi:AAEL002402-PA [Gryllus bimaculatus]|nr:AAEL002402-PA [Gryllus bimaculatus]
MICKWKSLLSPGREMHAIKKGLLWQQRDRLFSRWKERYFILTRDYLHCFKRATGSAENRISDMGQFIFKVKLVDVERVEWVNRRTYSAVVLTLGRDGRVLLRAAEGLEDWFELLEECTLASKERRQMLRKSHDPSWPRTDNFNNNSIASNLEDWLLARQKIVLHYYYYYYYYYY